MYTYLLNGCLAVAAPVAVFVAPSPCFCTVNAVNGVHP